MINFTITSLSNSLESKTVFEYWQHLLTHTSITDPISTGLQQDVPVEFVKESY